MTAPIQTDAVIIGAGPVGLFQVFELGLLELRAHVVDALPYIGGQCTALYADKPIYDIPGLPRCTGRELIERLREQIKPFDAPIHLGQEVSAVARQSDGRFLVESTAGTRWLAPVVIIAGGVGAFQPRRLKLEGLGAFEGSQLFYQHQAQPAQFAGKRVLILGDDDHALEQAMACVPYAAEVTLLHRREEFRATPDTLAQWQALRAAKKVQFVAAQPTGIECAAGQLTGLTVQPAEGPAHTLAFDALWVLTGLSPRLGPIAQWGVALEHKQVQVDTEKFETSVPGIFAVGDVNIYPGKKRLILSGFHEAALAAFAAAARVNPSRHQPLEYTTSSAHLHRLLKVDGGLGAVGPEI